MIIANGYIEPVVLSPGELDENGYPTDAERTYGKAVECQVVPARVNRLALATSERVTAAILDIYVDMAEVDPDITALRLTYRGRTTEDYLVASVKPLEAVGQLKITVKSHAD